MPEHAADPDVTLADHGTIALLTPLTEEAIAWCTAHLPDDALRHGAAYAVEPRYAGPILDGMSEAGLQVAVA